MNAVILAGGFGKRLMPLTSEVPKPMLKICNTPMIDYCISQASHFGISNFTLTLAHLPEQIIEWCNGYENLRFNYSIEKSPLGTFGGVKLAKDYLDDNFFVLSGDGLNDINLKKMAKWHFDRGADITIAVTKSNTPWLYGVVKSENGWVKNFYEKPAEFVGNTVNTGVYLMNKKLLSYLGDGNYDFAKDLFPILLERGKINIYEHDGYWDDIGNPKSYYDGNFFVKNGGFFPFAKNSLRERNSVDKNSNLISTSSLLEGEIKNCVVEKNCQLYGKITNCLVTAGAKVKGDYDGCIIMPNERIEIK